MSEGSCRENNVQNHRLQTSLSSGSTQTGESGGKAGRRQCFADKSTIRDRNGGRASRTGGSFEQSNIWLRESVWQPDHDPDLRAAS